jgi:hypothetical protein
MEDANRHTFVYDPERDGPAEFVPPRSLHIAGEAKLEANTSNEPTNNPTHEAVQSYWGERCAEHEDGCPTCVAWEYYDNLVMHEQHHAQAKEKFPNLFDEFAERAPKDVQEAMIRILNARTTRAKHEQGLDKV